jgi:hypothetical protein
MKTLTFLFILFLGLCSHAENFTQGDEQKPFTPDLKAGDYVWKPEASPAGPVFVIVSIPDQTLYVYRNGIRIGRSTISTGKSGHRTPTGVFTVLEKNVTHHSSIYKGASMPYMQRLTWGGIAMHAGQLPGYPASHGCVRLPVDFAQKLYQVTGKGTTVFVTDGKTPSAVSTRPGLILSLATTGTTTAPSAGGFTWQPSNAPAGPVSILFSSADREVYVYRNGIEIGRSAIGGNYQDFGNYAYTALTTVHPDGSRDWSALGSFEGSPSPDFKDIEKHLVIPPDFLVDARAALMPGTVLIVTDQPVNASTRSNTGFNILTTAATP